MKNKPCFIISHKWVRGTSPNNKVGKYISYLKYYLENIQNFYKNSLTIVVDNNSTYKEDIFDEIKNFKNLILLDNNIDSKFEIGAYTVGLNYLIQNNLIEDYNYYVFTQDNFIIKNKYNFIELDEKNIKACPINDWHPESESSGMYSKLIPLGLHNNLDKISFCWCSSFVVHHTKIKKLHEYLSKIKIINRWESACGERFLSRILWELNEGKNYNIDGTLDELRNKYDCWSVDLFGDVPTYFAKRVQQKTENTKDIS